MDKQIEPGVLEPLAGLEVFEGGLVTGSGQVGAGCGERVELAALCRNISINYCLFTTTDARKFATPVV